MNNGAMRCVDVIKGEDKKLPPIITEHRSFCEHEDGRLCGVKVRHQTLLWHNSKLINRSSRYFNLNR